MLSPQQAANQVQVSRRTIMIAIESQELKATRNNKNHWKIRPEDLEEWVDVRGSFRKPVPSSESPAISELQLLLEVSQSQIRDLEGDRDAWRSQAEQLSETLKNLTKTDTPRESGGVPSIFRRFFRDS